MKNIPEKTIERLSQYRRALLESISEGKPFIFSHQLAAMMHITPVQVRRDLMLIGYSGTLRKGYNVAELVIQIGKIVDSQELQKIAVIGVGNLGRAIISYFNGKRAKLSIVAAFDLDPDKINRIVSGVYCYHLNQLDEIISKENISIAVITVPHDQAVKVADKLVRAGIKGILNYTSMPLNVASHVYVEEYDIITSLEKTAYFGRKKGLS